MAKKKGKEQPKKAEPVKAPEPKEEEVACPVCGKPVGSEVTSCPHCGAEFEEEAPESVPQPEAAAPAPSEEETADCPVCGRAVGLSAASCPYCGAEFEAEAAEAKAEEAPAAEPAKGAPVSAESETADCPVCGKPVSLDVASCPYCGAQFEEEEVEEVVEEEVAEGGFVTPTTKPEAAGPAVTSGEETADCPVCGKAVSLDVSTCPFCGAEFEQEEVEEVIEVEEEAPEAVAPVEAEEPEVAVEEVVPEAEVEEVTAEDRALSEIQAPTSITDMRVIGISLIILGILGSQIAFMIDWYWTWVPPIKDNIGMFVAIPVVVIVVGLLVFMLVKRGLGSGKKIPRMMPGMSLSLFLFGILALVLVMLWNPINSALQDSSGGVGVAFVAILLVGVFVMFMGQKMTARNASRA